MAKKLEDHDYQHLQLFAEFAQCGTFAFKPTFCYLQALDKRVHTMLVKLITT